MKVKIGYQFGKEAENIHEQYLQNEGNQFQLENQKLILITNKE